MSRIGKQRSSTAAAALSLGAAAIPLIAGVALTLSLADDSLRRENLRVGFAALEQVDELLASAFATIEELAPMSGSRCDAALQGMRMEVARNPWLRSTSLTYKGQPYCDSISGTISNPPAKASRLPFTGNAVLELLGPGRSGQAFGSLLLTKVDNNYGVKVEVDNRLLVDRLDLVSGTTDVAMKVGSVYLWDDGSLLHGELRQNPTYRAHLPSSRFDYAMHSSVSAEDMFNLLTEKLIAVLGALVMVSILTGGLCHWVLTRQRGED